MATIYKYAPTAWRMLNGMFAVYKPSGVGIKSFGDTIKQRLADDLNSMEQRPQKNMVVFKQLSDTANAQYLAEENANSLLKPTLELDWFDHPLVQGPRYSVHDFVVSMGHTLDMKACGVQVIGLGKLGEQLCGKARSVALPRTYRAWGHLGVASLSATGDTKITDRSTWGHVTADRIHRVLNHVQGAHRNSCLIRSGVDLATQEAYEMAAEGLLRPHGTAGIVIVDLKLAEFKRPHFAIDVTCINEACQDIRQLVHEIGLILKSTAICIKLQRRQDGPFMYDDNQTLLTHQINANSVIESMQHSRSITGPAMWRRRQHFSKTTIELPENVEQKLLAEGRTDMLPTSTDDLASGDDERFHVTNPSTKSNGDELANEKNFGEIAAKR